MIRLAVIFATSILLTVVGCENYSLINQLKRVDDSLAIRHYQDTSLWRSLSALRTEVIAAHDAECDSIYNAVVLRVVETAARGRHDLYTYLNFLKGATSILTQSDLGMAHDLRYWGSYDAARSQYGRIAVATAMSNTDALANLGMEYERVGLLREALRYVNAADSLFKTSGSIRGRMWTSRLLYDIHSKLGNRLNALQSLRMYGMLHREHRRFDSQQMADTITDVNLIRSIFRRPTWKQDLIEAFGEDAQEYLSMYHTVIAGAPAMWENQWLSKNPLLGPLPKPVIRSIRVDRNTIAAVDSIVPDRLGELAYATRFGTYVLRGSEFLLTVPKYPELNSNFASTQPPIRLDTILSSTAGFDCVVPFGQDSVVAFTRDSVHVFTSGQRSRHPRPNAIKKSIRILDVTAVGASHVVMLLPNKVVLLRRSDFKFINSVTLDTARTSGALVFGNDLGIKALSPTVLTVRDGESAGSACVSVDTSNSCLRVCTISSEAKQGQGKAILTYHSGFLGLISWRMRGNDTILITTGQVIAQSIIGSRGDDLGLVPIRTNPPFLAIKQYDNVDIIDTSKGMVYPQFAVPLPIDRLNAQRAGVFRNSSGILTGCYCDGYTIVTFRLSQQSYRLHPRFYIIDPAIDATDTSHVRQLESGQRLLARRGYSVAIGSNMITSSFPLMIGFDDSTLSSEVFQEGRTFWSTPVVPKPEQSMLYVSTPLLTRPVSVAISDPIMVRPWIAPFMISLTGVLGLAVAFGLIRSRRRGQLLAIERAKTEQLELLREDMHDMIGSRLVRIASLARQTPPERHEEALSRIHDMTLVTVRSLRNLLTLMSETSMTDAGFNGSLREYVTESTNDAGLHCMIEIEIDSFDRMSLDSASRHEILMIVSEMLTNTLRHSQAHCVSFTIDARGAQTTITWSDDGVGMAPAAKRGNGLNNIQRRATRIGATVTVNSESHGGTKFIIAYPTYRFRG